MHLDEIADELDAYFALDVLPPDSPFSHLLPATFKGTDIRLDAVLERSFLERFHGCSHYASEAVVMRHDVVNLCAARFGIQCEFVPQDDPW